MKKFLLILFFCVSCHTCLYSQEQVVFKLLPDGSFTSTQGNNYAVVQFENNSAEELFEMVYNNLFNLYKFPESVLRVNKYNTIYVHGYMDMGKIRIVLLPRALGGYYNLKFSFKDGRIRIDAPTFDNPLICTDGSLDPPAYPSFANYAKSLFKNGKPNSNYVNLITNLENTLNGIINYSLGTLKDSSDDDW